MEDDLRDWLCRNGIFVTERVLKNVLAVRWSLRSLLLDCTEATFVMFSVAVHDEEVNRNDWGVCLQRLRKHYKGLRGMRFYEHGRRGGRFHIHAVFDRRMDFEVLDWVRRETTLGWTNVKAITSDGLGAYLWKEVSKQMGRGSSTWAQFGDWRGKTLVGDVLIDSDRKECMREAFAARQHWESFARTRGMGEALYWAGHGLGMGEVGDAFEPEGGDGSFDVGEFESWSLREHESVASRNASLNV